MNNDYVYIKSKNPLDMIAHAFVSLICSLYIFK